MQTTDVLNQGASNLRVVGAVLAAVAFGHALFWAEYKDIGGGYLSHGWLLPTVVLCLFLPWASESLGRWLWALIPWLGCTLMEWSTHPAGIQMIKNPSADSIRAYAWRYVVFLAFVLLWVWAAPDRNGAFSILRKGYRGWRAALLLMTLVFFVAGWHVIIVVAQPHYASDFHVLTGVRSLQEALLRMSVVVYATAFMRAVASLVPLNQEHKNRISEANAWCPKIKASADDAGTVQRGAEKL